MATPGIIRAAAVQISPDFEAPDGDVFYWIATESRRARMMRKFFEGHHAVPRDWIRSTGYWKAHADDTDGD